MATTSKTTLNLRYTARPESRDALLTELRTILDRCAQEPEFLSAIVQESPERPNEIMVFELWRGTPQEFARVQGPKPYRKEYMERSKLLYDNVQAIFSIAAREWGTTLLNQD